MGNNQPNDLCRAWGVRDGLCVKFESVCCAVYTFFPGIPTVSTSRHLALAALPKGWNSCFHANRRAKTPLIRWNVWGGTQPSRSSFPLIFLNFVVMLFSTCFLPCGLVHRIWRIPWSYLRHARGKSLPICS